MDVGIFEPGGVPSGLHIEGRKLGRPVKLNAGAGNFDGDMSQMAVNPDVSVSP